MQRKPSAQVRELLQKLWRGYQPQKSLAGCFLGVFLSTAFADWLVLRVGFSTQFSISNGFLLSYLLLVPRWLWTRYLLVGLAGMLAGSLMLHMDWHLALVTALIDLIEVLLCMILLRKNSRQLPEFPNERYLLRFVIVAIIVSPLASGLLYGGLTGIFFGKPFWEEAIYWVVSVSLGTAVAVPACVAILRERFGLRKVCWVDLAYFAVVVLASYLAYRSPHSPVIFFLYPLLLLAVIFRGLAWASFLLLFVGYHGGWMTLHGRGPLACALAGEKLNAALVQLLFITAGIVMVYLVEGLMDRRHQAETRLQEMAALHSLVTENSRDVIVVADLDGKQSYISQACEQLTGWAPEELIGHKGFDAVHPEDLPKACEVMEKLKSGAGDFGNLECRIRRRDGEYVWIESSLRSIRHPRTGRPNGVLNMVRDISERKESERRLRAANLALQELAVTDALTGLSNRRRFDQAMATEWRRAARNRTPLSLLLTDVDLFKGYNDEYGHLRGDYCLKTVGSAISSVLLRPGDLVSRYGGEEFAVILPATENAGAMQIAERVCEAVRSRRLRYANVPAGVVTISVGCATLVPEATTTHLTLTEQADRALYRAKGKGRNRVENAILEEAEEVISA